MVMSEASEGDFTYKDTTQNGKEVPDIASHHGQHQEIPEPLGDEME